MQFESKNDQLKVGERKLDVTFGVRRVSFLSTGAQVMGGDVEYKTVTTAQDALLVRIPSAAN